jgi:hypothetical protein
MGNLKDREIGLDKEKKTGKGADNTREKGLDKKDRQAADFLKKHPIPGKFLKK